MTKLTNINVTCVFWITILGFILDTFKSVDSEVGVAYSPFVQDEDHPGTDSYTMQDVKVMLEIIAEEKIHLVSTYGVGAPDERYVVNSTWTRCSSVVHTALAAAQLNKEKHKTELSIYQGLYPVVPSQIQLDSEIEVGFEMANAANAIHKDTVKGIIFPSDITFGRLKDMKEKVLTVSNRTRSLNLQFGTRLVDCAETIPKQDKTDKNIQDMIRLFDFIICQTMPNANTFANGPERFKRRITNGISDVTKALKQMGLSTQVILESGWPGGRNLDRQNTVEDMFKFWELLKHWSNNGTEKRLVFMHEAFNNPWKDSINAIRWGAHYGLWKHKNTNDNSKNGYSRKEAEILAPRSNETGGTSNELIIGIVFGTVLFILVVIMMILLYRRVTKLNNNKLSPEEIRQFLDGIVANEVVDPEAKDNAWKRAPYNREFELAKHAFFIDKTDLLGSGAFGSVFKGTITGLVNPVAFKMTRPDCPVSALRGLLSEIKILSHLGKHDNIVSICGAYTTELENGIVYVATELCSNSSLEKYLRINKTSYANIDTTRYVASPPGLPSPVITDSQLLQWSVDIASAMEYISSRNVIHADLAARNILLTENLTAKVTDFGLSRRLYEYTEYVKKNQEPLPWRWMAVESLKQLEFSTKSDVWSYGITLWEMYSLGDIPYPGLSWDINFVTELENGLRMQSPSRAPSNIYGIMTSSWNLDPARRPTFQTIKNTLLAMLVNNTKCK
ncbi:unnamed protein product [Orchesella dallaii]|uniref:Protein kinase domain-containing protein n=1 Tax=Orchesella dallaii TaxID=48710 RepID=A0ABP1R2V8_9HEXA